MQLTPIVTTDKLAETRDFYLKHFDFQVVWDSPHYVQLKKGEVQVAFSAPREGEPRLSGGLMLGLEVKNVDDEHGRLAALGLACPAPRDNPWGDRSMDLLDPAGVVLHVHHPIPVSAEYRTYLKA